MHDFVVKKQTKKKTPPTTHRLFSWLYNASLCLGSFAFLPSLCFNKRKFSSLFKRKWGEGFEFIFNNGQPLVWIHAVSMGETRAIASFATQFKKKYPNARFIVTSVTETGHVEAQRSLPFANHFLFLPFDLSWIIKPIVKRIRPDLVILSETDYWYHFASAAKNCGAKLALINGKMSERSFRRYRWLGKWLEHYFSPVDLFIVQSERYKERFQALGISEKKIVVGGNLKLDAPVNYLNDSERTEWRQRFSINPEDLVIVAGSTHESEEALILNVFQALAPDFPELKLFIAPRHPARFNAVQQLIMKYPYPAIAYSQMEGKQGHERIFLIDAMGQLNTCYQLATLAIVGGSFNQKIGGHNILEPCAFGKPVLFGPHMNSQLDFLDLVKNYQAGVQVHSDHLEHLLRTLLTDHTRRKEIGSNALRLTQDLQGASHKALEYVERRFRLSHIFELPKKTARSNIVPSSKSVTPKD